MSTQTAERPETAAVAGPAPAANIVPIETRRPPAPRAYPADLLKRVFAIKRGIGNVGKDGWNSFHQYHYRKWEDVLDMLSPLMSQHGVLIIPNEISRSLIEDEQAQVRNDMLVGITYEFIIVSEQGDEWPERPRISAFARIRDGKGVHDDKAASKCHTQADKEFLIHFFKIPVTGAPESDADGTEVAQQEQAKPKPPKPGSAEAKALDGPRAIPTGGISADEWVDAFLKAIEGKGAEECAQWIAANKTILTKLDAPQFAEQKKRVYAVLNPAPPKPPKPPKPAAAAPPAPVVPDPATNQPGWIEWLRAKMSTFTTFEAGESYWNDRIDPMDLSRDAQEEAMGVWQRFEDRFAP
jgi:hypothetical protein